MLHTRSVSWGAGLPNRAELVRTFPPDKKLRLPGRGEREAFALSLFYMLFLSLLDGRPVEA